MSTSHHSESVSAHSLPVAWIACLLSLSAITRTASGVEGIPLNTTCEDAVAFACNSIINLDNTGIDNPPDPPHPCGADVNHDGTVWYKFVAGDTTARLFTCDSIRQDSTITVFAGDCANLTPIGCGEDDCGPSGWLTDLCVSGLTPGHTYYVQFSAWSPDDRGPYTLEIQCPCPDVATGACCREDQTCTDSETLGGCSAAGGVYLGDDSVCLGDGNGNGLDDACDGPLVAFSQPAQDDGQAVPSNLDLNDLNPNIAVVDDFRGDGRAIEGVRWWGGPTNQAAADWSHAASDSRALIDSIRATHRAKNTAAGGMPVFALDANAISPSAPNRQPASAGQVLPTSANPAALPAVRFASTTVAEMVAFDRNDPSRSGQIAPSPGQAGALEIDTHNAAPSLLRTPAVPGGVLNLPSPPLLDDFAGTLDNATFIPPDTMGAVGPDHIAEILNSGFQVFDRAGAVVLPLISHRAFWSALGTGTDDPAENPFDPKIIYDQETNRWIATADSNSFSPFSYVLVGISLTDDPTGAWNLFAILADPNSVTWADYPGLGLDSANVYLTNNMFTFGGAFTVAKMWVISKASMIAGGPLDLAAITSPVGGFTWQPCHVFGGASTGLNHFVSQGWSIGQRRFLRVLESTGVGSAAVLADLGFIEVAPYSFGQGNAPQLGCAVPIETNDARMLNAVSRSGHIWATHSAGDALAKTEIAWYEFDPDDATLADPFGSPIQQGRVSDPQTYYYFPSIAVNADHCVALGFSGSNEDIYASAYFTAREPSDPLGTMREPRLLKAGLGPYWKQYGGTRNRWGDYSATVLDPLDDRTFWTVQEYAATPFGNPVACNSDGGRWGTWWGAFRCDTSVGPDGWLISFHEPRAAGNDPAPPLGGYFCDTAVVRRAPADLATCDESDVQAYTVALADCCLIHASADSRTGATPADPDRFQAEVCLEYDLSVQGVVGKRFQSDGNDGCDQTPTQRTAETDFWAWHTAPNEQADRAARTGSVTMPDEEWLYGDFGPLNLQCAEPNMAFELLTEELEDNASVCIVNAESCLVHGAGGAQEAEWCIDFDRSNGIEPRNGGPAKIRLEMSADMNGATVSSANLQMTCANRTPTGLTASLDGMRTIVVQFDQDALVPADCCTIQFAGMTSLSGQPVADTTQIVTLWGDTDFSGGVSGGDASRIKPWLGRFVGEPGVLPEFDFNIDAGVSGGDFALIKPHFNRVSPACP